MVTFNPIDHSYYLTSSGERLLSVTQILSLSGLTPDYSTVPPAILKHAAERGSYVDEACNLFDEDDLDWDHFRAKNPEAVPYVEAWQNFRENEIYTPFESNVIVHHPELLYAGTIDSLGMSGPDATIIERKCTDKQHAAHCVQAAGYALDGIERFNGRPDRWVVYLKKDGDYDVLDCDKEMARTGRDDFKAFEAAVAIARWKLAGQNGGRRR